jgi:phosphotransferase system, enzyme I, PtsP
MSSALPSLQAASAAREILRRMHEVMAARLDPQSKLNSVTKTIARGLRSEVCSMYVLREGVLELFSTEGLAQSAVHITKMRVGEGLVGTIAERRLPLNLAEARAHPDFAYRPETGEDDFHSFAGVPVLRQGEAVGVICVQHSDPRDYADEEIEALQTVAMVLAELISAEGLIDDKAIAAARAQRTGVLRLTGQKLVDGLARGVAVFHQPRVEVEHTVAEDIEAEKERLRTAFQTMRTQIDRMMTQAEFGGVGEHQDILETYKMFAFDEGWARRINEAIDSGLTAEAAIERVQQQTRVTMRRTQDPYLLERLNDLDDLANRLMRIVAGKIGTAADLGLTQDSILIAKNLGPAELLEYDRRRLKGVVLEEGSPTAHVIIIARAMGVPVLGRCREIKEAVAPGDLMIVDATSEALFVRPSIEMARQYENRTALKAKRQAEYAAVRDLPACTKDGVRIELMMNAGLKIDLSALAVTNADGIGLFRTEFQFLVSATLPRRQAQTQLYKAVLDSAGAKPVVFRTVDIGGDKAVPYLRGEYEEENPAMGWRALRVALERTGLLKVQARALLEAAADRDLNLMFPMVTETREFTEAKNIVREEIEAMRTARLPVPRAIRYGAMLEVPSLAFELDALLAEVEFVSIGTNDLLQFFFAADRGHPKLADRYDWLSPSVLRFLKQIFDSCAKANKPVSVCGEMGGRTLEAMALIGIGARRLSITPAAIGPVKTMIRGLDLMSLRSEMADWLTHSNVNIRAQLIAWAEQHNVPLA